ncbi:hypothetical protein EG329_005994 [Mollisiaceae sp. DMI_Dod_QoI]|nr:hypothetical protein EG329_005994 [Helotiales sp. DMI_Dod_QoI]
MVNLKKLLIWAVIIALVTMMTLSVQHQYPWKKTRNDNSRQGKSTSNEMHTKSEAQRVLQELKGSPSLESTCGARQTPTGRSTLSTYWTMTFVPASTVVSTPTHAPISTLSRKLSTDLVHPPVAPDQNDIQM